MEEISDVTIRSTNKDVNRRTTTDGLAAMVCGVFVSLMLCSVVSGNDAVVPPEPSETFFDRHESRLNVPEQVPDFLVGSQSTTSIRSIPFVRPREAGQSVATLVPRTSSVHSTVNWVSPRAVHRSLFFNDNP